MVCDAGGSTADISAYMVKSTTSTGLALEELDVPSCKCVLLLVLWS